MDFQGPFDPGVDSLSKFSALPSFRPLPGSVPFGGTGGEGAAGGAQGWVLLGLLSVVAIFGGLRWLAGQRRFRFLAPADRGWARMAQAGGRTGVARQASETFYEYAGWLETQVPTRAGEIRIIADGKVWQSYSGRSMNERAIERIERAWARLRLPLIWLALRRRVASLLGRPS